MRVRQDGFTGFQIANEPEAVHRFPGSLGARVRELPGLGKQKAQIYVALPAKQLGVRPEGWEAAANGSNAG